MIIVELSRRLDVECFSVIVTFVENAHVSDVIDTVDWDLSEGGHLSESHLVALGHNIVVGNVVVKADCRMSNPGPLWSLVMICA